MCQKVKQADRLDCRRAPGLHPDAPREGRHPLSTVPLKLYSGIDGLPFLSIPLFILAGGLVDWCRMSEVQSLN